MPETSQPRFDCVVLHLRTDALNVGVVKRLGECWVARRALVKTPKEECETLSNLCGIIGESGLQPHVERWPFSYILHHEQVMRWINRKRVWRTQRGARQIMEWSTRLEKRQRAAFEERALGRENRACRVTGRMFGDDRSPSRRYAPDVVKQTAHQRNRLACRLESKSGQYLNQIARRHDSCASKRYR